jgi:hypothetical protein
VNLHEERRGKDEPGSALGVADVAVWRLWGAEVVTERCATRPSTASNKSNGSPIDFVASFDDIGGGHGGYNQDHEHFGCHHSL